MPDNFTFDFSQSALPAGMRWYCEPKDWRIDTVNRQLVIHTLPDTDYWSKTFYNFIRHDGHFLYLKKSGLFTLTAHVSFSPVNQYDQSGILFRFSPDCWLKTSIEYEGDQPARLGAVVTNHGFSDWSTQDVDKNIRDIWLRVQRAENCYLVEFSTTGSDWQQLRLAYLAEDNGRASEVDCGIYACSPQGAGYVAKFDLFKLEHNN